MEEVRDPPPTAPRPLPAHLSLTAGLLMGAADAVPGVSGGTIALVIGVWERFVGALGALVRSPRHLATPEGRRGARAALGLLVPLGVGLLAAWWAGTRLLVGPEEAPGLLRRAETARLCYAFFFGLVLASLPEPWRRLRRPRRPHLAAAATGAALAATFALLPAGGAGPVTPLALVLGGAIAVTVMLLPGISGSLALVVLGQYRAVAGAVHDFDPVRLGAFLGGVVLGVAACVPLLRRLLATRHDATLATLTGLMAGSLVALWPWKTGYEEPHAVLQNAPVGDGALAVLAAALAGAAAVVLLARLERRILRAPGR